MSDVKVREITNRCTNCNLCPPVCPTKSIHFGGQRFAIDTDTCHGCGICETVCPEGAVRLLDLTQFLAPAAAAPGAVPAPDAKSASKSPKAPAKKK